MRNEAYLLNLNLGWNRMEGGINIFQTGLKISNPNQREQGEKAHIHSQICGQCVPLGLKH